MVGKFCWLQRFMVDKFEVEKSFGGSNPKEKLFRLDKTQQAVQFDRTK